jgi:hypothetical protein
MATLITVCRVRAAVIGSRVDLGSRGAYEAHVASPHYEGIAVAQIRPLLSDRIVEFCQVIAAEDSG